MGPEALSSAPSAAETLDPGDAVMQEQAASNREEVFDQFGDLSVPFNGEMWSAKRIADECTFIGSMSVGAMVETFTAIRHDQIRKQEFTPEELVAQRAERMKNMAKRMEAIDERQRQAAEKPDRKPEEKAKESEKVESEKRVRQAKESETKTVEPVSANTEVTPEIKAAVAIPAAIIAELHTEKVTAKPTVETPLANEVEAFLEEVVEQQHRGLSEKVSEPEIVAAVKPIESTVTALPEQPTPANHPEAVVTAPATPDEILWERELRVEPADEAIFPDDIITPGTAAVETVDFPATDAYGLAPEAEPAKYEIPVLPLPTVENVDGEAVTAPLESFEDLDLSEINLADELPEFSEFNEQAVEQTEENWLSEADQELLAAFRAELGLEPFAEHTEEEGEAGSAETTLSLLSIETPVEASPEIVGMVEQIGEQLATLEPEAAAEVHVQLTELGKSLRHVEKLLSDDQTNLSPEEITTYKEEIAEQLQAICESLGLEYSEEEIKQLVNLLLTQPELSTEVDIQKGKADGAETQLSLSRGTHERLSWFMATIRFKKRLGNGWRHLGRQAMQPLIAFSI